MPYFGQNAFLRFFFKSNLRAVFLVSHGVHRGHRGYIFCYFIIHKK
jgi:hypothetical protein